MEYFTQDVIDAKSLTLNEWLIYFLKSEKIFPSNCFPTDSLLNEYIANVDSQTDTQVKNIVRRLLVHNGRYGQDARTIDIIKTKSKKEVLDLITSREFYRRLIFTKSPWEGITWVLDLLPDAPIAAIDVINNYFDVHCLHLPDNPFSGLGDAAAVIRAKYITYEHPQDVFLSMTPDRFELIVEYLYKLKGYDTQLTQKTRDGGRDIIAEKRSTSGTEKLVIQCKRYKGNVPVKDIRELSGVIQNYPINYGERVTKGVIVCSSDFTPPARNEFRNDHSIEFINYKLLGEQLNQLAGKNWPNKLEKLLWSKE
jgi:restriction system protein